MHGSCRFIPTCVENMLPRAASSTFFPVHPHMRGEYVLTAERLLPAFGSSPHAWRISLLPGSLVDAYRFIPTCVENMRSWMVSTPVPAGSSPHAWRISYVQLLVHAVDLVHPHMRGEYHLRAVNIEVDHGSSPHAWRIFSAKAIAGGQMRFIPTCVENI